MDSNSTAQHDFSVHQHLCHSETYAHPHKIFPHLQMGPVALAYYFYFLLFSSSCQLFGALHRVMQKKPFLFPFVSSTTAKKNRCIFACFEKCSGAHFSVFGNMTWALRVESMCWPAMFMSGQRLWLFRT